MESCQGPKQLLHPAVMNASECMGGSQGRRQAGGRRNGCGPLRRGPTSCSTRTSSWRRPPPAQGARAAWVPSAQDGPSQAATRGQDPKTRPSGAASLDWRRRHEARTLCWPNNFCTSAAPENILVPPLPMPVSARDERGESALAAPSTREGRPHTRLASPLALGHADAHGRDDAWRRLGACRWPRTCPATPAR